MAQAAELNNISTFESFKDRGVEKVLEQCEKAKHRPLFAPEVANLRIDAQCLDTLYQPKSFRYWVDFYQTASLIATGRSKAGNAVVVYAHIPHYFLKSENVKKANEDGLVNGAGRMPQDEFQRLLDLEDGKNVFVVDYNVLRKSPSDVIPLDSEYALRHPQTIPFLGGECRAIKYLTKFREVYGKKSIGIIHSNELSDVPSGRLLFVGGKYDNYSLSSIRSLRSDCGLLAVPCTPKN